MERKKQWQREDEERRAREADAEVPAGHRLMADDERLQTLDNVQLSTYTAHLHTSTTTAAYASMSNISAYSRPALNIYVNIGSGHHQPRLEFFALCTKSRPYLFFTKNFSLKDLFGCL